MEKAIKDVEEALQTLGEDPWSKDIKASDRFLTPLFRQFYKMLGLPNEMSKSNYHVLAEFVAPEMIDDEICQTLDIIYEISQRAKSQENLV